VTNLGAYYVAPLKEKLFEPEKRRLNAVINDVNQNNKRLKSLTTDGFLFRGQFYRPTMGTVVISPKGDPKALLHSSLIELMEKWTKDKMMILEDSSLINQILFVLLHKCVALTEIRDALPECLVSLVPRLAGLQRQYVEAYTIVDDKKAYQRFIRMLPKIEFYAATRFIY
jgi:hypothetical protein